MYVASNGESVTLCSSYSVSVLFSYVYRPLQYFKVHGIPGPKPVPVFGNLNLVRQFAVSYSIFYIHMCCTQMGSGTVIGKLLCTCTNSICVLTLCTHARTHTVIMHALHHCAQYPQGNTGALNKHLIATYGPVCG